MSKPDDRPDPRGDAAIPPREDAGGLRQCAPPRGAAGIGSVKSSLAYTWRQAGILRGGKALLHLNQLDGFDCPSCAWPDPKDRAMVEFCENGARATADESTTRRVDADFFAAHSIEELAARSDQWLNARGRLTEPMVLRAGAERYERIAWDDAFALIGATLRELPDSSRAAFYTSGRTSNEAAFLYQLFVRSFGTNNLPDCSNMCHESSGVGLSESIGIGKGTVTLEDFSRANLIWIFGQNPGTNHPRMLSALREAKLGGARIIAVNPLREPGLVRFRHPQKVGDLLGGGVDLADEYLQIRVGGDVALVKGVLKALFASGQGVDAGFVADNVDGYEALRADIESTSWGEIEAGSGLAREVIERVAALHGQSEAVIVTWAMGITQHRHGVANVQMLANLLLVGGHVGRPGAGLCPVRGHSNVQGDRTVGIWEKFPPWGEAMEAHFGLELPRETGHDVVGAIRAMSAGEVEVFVALGGNFVSATPDTLATASALRSCRLTVHVSTKLNRSHLVPGTQALILPCLGRTERDGEGAFVSVENSWGSCTARAGSSRLLPSISSRSRRSSRASPSRPWGRSIRSPGGSSRANTTGSGTPSRRSFRASRTTTGECVSRAASRSRTLRGKVASRQHPGGRSSTCTPSRRWISRPIDSGS